MCVCGQHGIDEEQIFDVGIFFALFALIILQLIFSCFADAPPVETTGKVCKSRVV